MDIRDVLTLDHREAVRLAQLMAAPGAQVDCCIAAQRRLAELLHQHVHAEESVLYAALEQSQPVQTAALLARGRAEHRDMAAALAALAAHRPAGAAWRAGSQQLLAALLEHVAGEHERVFALLAVFFSADERAQLGLRVLQRLHEPPALRSAPGRCPLARWCARQESAPRAAPGQ